jgi:hypothetical protein
MGSFFIYLEFHKIDTLADGGADTRLIVVGAYMLAGQISEGGSVDPLAKIQLSRLSSKWPKYLTLS